MRKFQLVLDLAKLILHRLFRASDNLCDLAVRAVFGDKSDELQLLFVRLAVAGLLLFGHSLYTEALESAAPGGQVGL